MLYFMPVWWWCLVAPGCLVDRAAQDKTYQGLLEATAQHVADWVCSSAFAAQVASLLPGSAGECGPGQDQVHIQREASTQAQCSDAFGAVQQFEGSHNLVLQNMSLAYVQHRNNLVSGLLEKGAALGLKDELVHDAVLLLDRAASTAAQVRLMLPCFVLSRLPSITLQLKQRWLLPYMTQLGHAAADACCAVDCPCCECPADATGAATSGLSSSVAAFD
jgi:hypothetical protein